MSDLADEFRVYAQDSARLRALPYAGVTEENDAVESLANELISRSPLEVIRWESNLSDPYFRVLALDFLRQRSPTPSETTVWEGRMLEEPVLIEGNLSVRGNLENASNLVVLGDLVVEGAYVARGDYPCCSVAGSMSVANFYASEAETICLGTLTVQSSLVVLYNHTVTITRRLVAHTLLTDDASVYRERFGIEFDEDADDFDPGEHIHERVLDRMLNAHSTRP